MKRLIIKNCDMEPRATPALPRATLSLRLAQLLPKRTKPPSSNSGTPSSTRPSLLLFKRLTRKTFPVLWVPLEVVIAVTEETLSDSRVRGKAFVLRLATTEGLLAAGNRSENGWHKRLSEEAASCKTCFCLQKIATKIQLTIQDSSIKPSKYSGIWAEWPGSDTIWLEKIEMYSAAEQQVRKP